LNIFEMRYIYFFTNSPVMMRKPTQLIYNILVFCLIVSPFSKTQGQSPADTTLAQAYLERTIVLADEGLEDSMSWYLLEAARLYQQAGLQERFLQKHLSDYQYVYESGYFSSVIEAKQAIVAAARKQLGDSHPLLAPWYYHLGRSLQMRGDNAEALEWVMRCLALRQSIKPTPWQDIAYTHNLMGVCYIGLYKFSEAIAQYNKALEIRKRELGPGTRSPHW
jgi:tetratricopeptide (TPR) repeat protein